MIRAIRFVMQRHQISISHFCAWDVMAANTLLCVILTTTTHTMGISNSYYICFKMLCSPLWILVVGKLNFTVPNYPWFFFQDRDAKFVSNFSIYISSFSTWRFMSFHFLVFIFHTEHKQRSDHLRWVTPDLGYLFGHLKYSPCCDSVQKYPPIQDSFPQIFHL